MGVAAAAMKGESCSLAVGPLAAFGEEVLEGGC